MALRETWTQTFTPIIRLRKKWILLVGGGILQLPSVQAAHELGYKVLVTDINPDCPCREMADDFRQISTFDVDGHLDLVREWRGGFVAVFTAGADPIVTVATAAYAAGCVGVPIRIAEICASKLETRRVLEEHGVPQPDWWGINNIGVLFDVLEQEGYGVYILKRLVGSGSRGHTKMLFYSGVTKEDLIHAANKSDMPALLERWIDGEILSVETLWHDGTMIPLNAVERPFDGIIELGHYNPLVTDEDTYQEIWNVMYQAGRAIGMDRTSGGHILKGDLVLSDDGPMVLELTTRLSGGFDSQETSPLAHGVNYTQGALMLALGYSLSEAMPYFVPHWYKHAACMAVFGPPDGGIIKEIRGVDAAREYANVILMYKSGDVLPALEDCTQRVAFCIASDVRPEVARDLACVARDLIEVVVE